MQAVGVVLVALGEAYQLSVPPNWPGVRLKMCGSSSSRSQPAGFSSSSHEPGSSCPLVPIDWGTL